MWKVQLLPLELNESTKCYEHNNNPRIRGLRTSQRKNEHMGWERNLYFFLPFFLFLKLLTYFNFFKQQKILLIEHYIYIYILVNLCCKNIFKNSIENLSETFIFPTNVNLLAMLTFPTKINLSVNFCWYVNQFFRRIKSTLFL